MRGFVPNAAQNFSIGDSSIMDTLFEFLRQITISMLAKYDPACFVFLIWRRGILQQ